MGKYTFFGDVNLDGQVTGDDYTNIDANLGSDPAVGIEWLSGDANLDGIVAGDDYTAIDANLGLGVGNPLVGARLSAVPEPMGLGIAAVGGCWGCAGVEGYALLIGPRAEALGLAEGGFYGSLCAVIAQKERQKCMGKNCR